MGNSRATVIGTLCFLIACITATGFLVWKIVSPRPELAGGVRGMATESSVKTGSAVAAVPPSSAKAVSAAATEAIVAVRRAPGSGAQEVATVDEVPVAEKAGTAVIVRDSGGEVSIAPMDSKPDRFLTEQELREMQRGKR